MKIAANALAQPRDKYNKRRGEWLKHWATKSAKPAKRKPQRLNAVLRTRHANN